MEEEFFIAGVVGKLDLDATNEVDAKIEAQKMSDDHQKEYALYKNANPNELIKRFSSKDNC